MKSTISHKPGCILVLHSSANSSQIKSAFDAALSIEIFEQPWELLIVFHSQVSDCKHFNDALERHLRFLNENSNICKIDWINLQSPDNHSKSERPQWFEKPEIPINKFHERLANARCVLTF